MELRHFIKEAEQHGIQIVPLDHYHEPGRLLEVKRELFLFLNNGLSDIEKSNVILHELAHYKNGDLHNILCQVPTYQHRIEHQAEIERIIDFISSINEEYPIDNTFNYIDYMTAANVPDRYENIVKETVVKLYEENIMKKRI